MWGIGSRVAVMSVALACAASCAGAQAESTAPSTAAAAGRRSFPARTTTTTAQPRPRRRTAPKPARWNGDGTPPPAIHNTGDDYLAIFQSLENYRRWLEAHHPDPALIPHVWVPGTKIAGKFRRHLGDLKQAHCRWVDVGDRSVATVVSVLDGTVTLRVDEYTSEVRILEASGRIAGTAKQGPVIPLIALLDRDGTGHWQIAAVERRLTNDMTVDL